MSQASLSVEELLQLGRLDETGQELLRRLQLRPDRADDWVMLAAVECVQGLWEQASGRLETAELMDSRWTTAAGLYRGLIRGESSRRGVFAGHSPPLLLGAPPDWIGWLTEALRLEAAGSLEAASQLREHFHRERPLFSGAINGAGVTSLRDADSRLGCAFEVLLQGEYYWLPFDRCEKVTIKAPVALMDLLWIPVQVQLAVGVEVSGHVPARYPGSELEPDSQIRLARLTDWRGEGSIERPVGQRLLVADSADYGLLECRTIEFGPPS